MKTSQAQIRLIDEAPATGVYHLDYDGTLHYLRNGLDWHYLEEPMDAFFLRVYGAGEYLFKGADIGILVTRTRMQTEDGRLTQRSHQFIDAIHGLFKTTDIDPGAAPTNYLAYLK